MSRKYRVRVRSTKEREARIVITKARWSWADDIKIAVVDLTDDDADYTLAEARANALAKADQLTALERRR